MKNLFSKIEAHLFSNYTSNQIQVLKNLKKLEKELNRLKKVLDKNTK